MYVYLVFAALWACVNGNWGFFGGGTASETETTCESPLILVDGVCTECAAGTYKGTDSCIDCAIGYYSDDVSQDECTECDSGLSTLSTGSTDSSDCISVCTVTLPTHASSTIPTAGTNVAEGTDITVTCDSGFQVSGSNTYTETCSDSPTACLSVSTTVSSNTVFEEDSTTFTCTVISSVAPSTSDATACKWYKDSSLLDTTATFSESSDSSSTYTCEYEISSAEDVDSEGDYTCEAVINGNDEQSTDTVSFYVIGIYLYG